MYYEQGQLDMAILHYKQAVARDPRFLEAYNNLVHCFAVSFDFNKCQIWKFNDQ